MPGGKVYQPQKTKQKKSPKRNTEIKSCLIILKNSQKWSKRFLICTEENQKKFGFSSVFGFKHAKEHILFQVQPLKM